MQGGLPMKIWISCQICEQPVVEVDIEDSKYLTATCSECWD
jgi:hypothetical protein